MTKQMMVVIVLFVYTLIRSVIVEPNSLEVTRYQIEDNRLQGIRVAFLSDFHLKRRDYKRLDKIVRITNQQNPDIVLFGGDFMQGNNEKGSMNPDILAQKLSLIDAPMYAVLAHSDLWSDGMQLTDALKRSGIKVLDNSAIRIVMKRRYLDIVGLSDATIKPPKIANALRRTAQPRIVITHNPDIYFDIVDEVSLILAGHTHGGQFIFPFTKPTFVSSKYGSEFASGLIKKTINKMIISKGIGTSGLPLRLNCKPEIVIVDFVRSGSIDKQDSKRRRR